MVRHNNLVFKFTALDHDLFKKNHSLKEDREQMCKSFSADIYIEEALNVLCEMKTK